MATDGVKIIDGDLAHDLYSQIMDLYDSDASIELIQKEVPFTRRELGFDTDFYHEIFVTTYALAFWEIGFLTDEILTEVKRVIDLKAGVKTWTEECDEKEGQKRQRELDKLLKKISQPNLKIRKRKKFKKVVNLLFQPDDALTFKLSDENYYAVVCTKVEQYRGSCFYQLAAMTYIGSAKPTIDELRKSSLAGLKIGSGYKQEVTLSMQPHVDDIWRYSGESNFFFGLCYDFIAHKDFISFKDRFEVVGTLKIRESFKKTGSHGFTTTFDQFHNYFVGLEKNIKLFRQEKYPVDLLLEF